VLCLLNTVSCCECVKTQIVKITLLLQIEVDEKLKKESKGLARDVFTLLYTTMIHDSHKHVGILEFLRDRLIQNRKPSKTN